MAAAARLAVAAALFGGLARRGEDLPAPVPSRRRAAARADDGVVVLLHELFKLFSAFFAFVLQDGHLSLLLFLAPAGGGALFRGLFSDERSFRLRTCGGMRGLFPLLKSRIRAPKPSDFLLMACAA